jgi:DNA-binding NarL/FixJ family response regulator
MQEMWQGSEPGTDRRLRIPAPIRVLIFARQPIVRAGLTGLLAPWDELELVGEVASVAEAEAQLQNDPPDVVLAAWTTAGTHELEGLAERASERGIALMALVDGLSPVETAGLLRAGARGMLRSDAGAEEIMAGIRAVVQGLLTLEPGLGQLLTATMRAAAVEDGPEETLTEREIEVLQLLAIGLPNKQIASRLRISEHTVKFHVGSILGKLGVSSRTEAVTHAARRGLLVL